MELHNIAEMVQKNPFIQQKMTFLQVTFVFDMCFVQELGLVLQKSIFGKLEFEVLYPYSISFLESKFFENSNSALFFNVIVQVSE